MAGRSYWLDLFTHKTWQEFLAAGATVSGFREGRWSIAQQLQVGDYLLCYLTGLSRFVGILEVVSPAYNDPEKSVWSDETFPCRVKVKLLYSLEPATGVPISLLKDVLSIFSKYPHPNSWTGAVRSSPARWSVADGEAVTAAIKEAMANPVPRQFDAQKLKYRPKAITAKVGPVTIPEADEPQLESAPSKSSVDAANADAESAHTEIQWLLLTLGARLGVDVWVAKNDKGKSYKGVAFYDIKGLRKSLPHQFDEATQKTVELIDVLWLKGNAIVAAFEVESTTSIYSGLLRLSDLIAMQPGIKIPLYIVAPDQRRNKVIAEVNRPTFAGLHPPMSEMCRFVAFDALREGFKSIEPMIQWVKLEYLQDQLSESCEVEEA